MQSFSNVPLHTCNAVAARCGEHRVKKNQQQLQNTCNQCNIRITDKQSATIYACYIRINEIKRSKQATKQPTVCICSMQNCAENSIFTQIHTKHSESSNWCDCCCCCCYFLCTSHTPILFLQTPFVFMYFFPFLSWNCCCCSFAQRTMSLIWSYNLQCNQINACFLFVIYKKYIFQQKKLAICLCKCVWVFRPSSMCIFFVFAYSLSS